MGIIGEAHEEDLNKKDEEIKTLKDKNAFLRKELEHFKCHANTLYAYAMPVELCPKCKEYILLEGYICFGCGYDRTDRDDNDEI